MPKYVITGWQRMDTAPKDGTQILGCGFGKGAITMAVVQWYAGTNRPGWWKLGVASLWAKDTEWNPDYWMPLPEPPESGDRHCKPEAQEGDV